MSYTFVLIARYQSDFSLQVNPLHPSFVIQILHTILYTLPKVLTRRISFIIRASFIACMMIISFILMTSMFDSAVILYREIRLLSRVRGLKMSVTIIIDLNWQVWL